MARRLGVRPGALLLTLFQLDSTADGTVVLVSQEHHLADAFEFTVYRRGPGRRIGERKVKPELVVGVDVGSQGTCAQALTPEGEQAAKAYVPHTLSYPQPGWAEQDPREWLGAVATGARRGTSRRERGRGARVVVRLAARRAGCGRRRRGAGGLRTDLDGSTGAGSVR